MKKSTTFKLIGMLISMTGFGIDLLYDWIQSKQCEEDFREIAREVYRDEQRRNHR